MRAGWSVEQAARRLDVSVRTYRAIEAGERSPSFGDVGPDLQALRVWPQTFLPVNVRMKTVQ